MDSEYLEYLQCRPWKSNVRCLELGQDSEIYTVVVGRDFADFTRGLRSHLRPEMGIVSFDLVADGKPIEPEHVYDELFARLHGRLWIREFMEIIGIYHGRIVMRPSKAWFKMKKARGNS